jgi:hypothetical protein
VEEPQTVPSDTEHANESAIRLLNEHLPKNWISTVKARENAGTYLA